MCVHGCVMLYSCSPSDDVSKYSPCTVAQFRLCSTAVPVLATTLSLAVYTAKLHRRTLDRTSLTRRSPPVVAQLYLSRTERPLHIGFLHSGDRLTRSRQTAIHLRMLCSAVLGIGAAPCRRRRDSREIGRVHSQACHPPPPIQTRRRPESTTVAVEDCARLCRRWLLCLLPQS